MREVVELARAYRLLNHGPTVLVSSAHGGRRDVMAAAWAMPLDFDPPKVALVIDKSTFTRELAQASGEFALNVPCRAQADLVFTAGSISGRDLPGQDKLAHLGLATFGAQCVTAPLVEGCVAWLECRVLHAADNEQRWDLFVAEVLAAAADARVFSHGRWHFDGQPDDLRTLHHVAAGAKEGAGEAVQARRTDT